METSETKQKAVNKAHGEQTGPLAFQSWWLGEIGAEAHQQCEEERAQVRCADAERVVGSQARLAMHLRDSTAPLDSAVVR